MQRCTTCGTTYEDSISTCPRDGTPLFATESDVEGLVEVSSEGVATLDELSDAIQHWEKADSEAVDDSPASNVTVAQAQENDISGDPTLIIKTADQIALQDREREAVTATVPIGEDAMVAQEVDASKPLDEPADETLLSPEAQPFESAHTPETEPAQQAQQNASPEPEDSAHPPEVEHDNEMRGTQIGAPGIVEDAPVPVRDHDEQRELEPRDRAPSAVPVSAMPTQDDSGSGTLLFGLFVVLWLFVAAGVLAHVMGVFSIEDFTGATTSDEVASAPEEVTPEAKAPVAEEPEIEEEPEPAEEEPAEEEPAVEVALAVATGESTASQAVAVITEVGEPTESEAGQPATDKPRDRPQAAKPPATKKRAPRARAKKPTVKKKPAPSPPPEKTSSINAVDEADTADEESAPAAASADEADNDQESLNIWGAKSEKEPPKDVPKEARARPESASSSDEAPLLPVDDDEPASKGSKSELEDTTPTPDEESDEEDSLDIW